MSETTNSGNYLWRGSQRIELEKEEEFFTAIVRDEAELERVRSLPGVIEVKPVQNRIFKVQVSGSTAANHTPLRRDADLF